MAQQGWGRRRRVAGASDGMRSAAACTYNYLLSCRSPTSSRASQLSCKPGQTVANLERSARRPALGSHRCRGRARRRGWIAPGGPARAGKAPARSPPPPLERCRCGPAGWSCRQTAPPWRCTTRCAGMATLPPPPPPLPTCLPHSIASVPAADCGDGRAPRRPGSCAERQARHEAVSNWVVPVHQCQRAVLCVPPWLSSPTHLHRSAPLVAWRWRSLRMGICSVPRSSW